MSKTKNTLLAAMSVGLTFLAACSNGASNTADQGDGANSDFPTQDITLIVPYSAGGGTDVLAREIAPLIEERLGVSVIVENQDGGSTVPALNEVLADDSGHTVILEGALIAGLQALDIADLGPDDFASVMIPQADPMALNVRADSEWQTIEDFVAAAEQSPNELTVATSAAGGVNHAAATLLVDNGLPVEIVPFNEGSAPAITALLGGRVDAVSMTPAEIGQYIEAEDVRMLAVGAEERLTDFPDVPTFEEAGLGGDLVKAFRVVLANPDTASERLSVLEEAFIDAAESDEFQAFLNEQSYVSFVLDSEETDEYLREQSELFNDVYAK